jgi:hypothetical protein
MLANGVEFKRHHAAVGHSQGVLNALGQALAQRAGFIGAGLDAVDHHIDIVLLVGVQRGQLIDLEYAGAGLTGTDAKAHITAGLQVFKQVVEAALTVSHHGGQDHQLGPLGQSEHGIDHLGHGGGGQGLVVVGAIGRAGAGVEQAQVVVDLGDGAHGGAWVVAGGLLLDGNGRAQALNHIDIGLVGLLQELSGVGRETFDIAALALGIERIERQARLPRTR